ncbi:MAG: peptidoglycan-binding domain-containing protein, partial [Actinomycetota bacterium]
MNGLGGRRSALLIAGVLLAVASPLLLVVFALNDGAPGPSAAASSTREVGVSLLALATDTASETLAKSVPPPPPPPPPAPAAPAAALPANPSGPEVLALEQKLQSIGYLVGKVDGVWDGATKHGVTAFQKVEQL